MAGSFTEEVRGIVIPIGGRDGKRVQERTDRQIKKITKPIPNQ